MCEAAHVRHGLAADGHARADSELHSFEQARHQDAGHEFGIHADDFELRPRILAGHGAVRASNQAKRGIFEFGGDGAQQIRADPRVAIGHHQQFVARLPQHAIQCVYFRVRIRRLAGDDEACGKLGVFAAQLLEYRRGGIVRLTHAEDDLELRIVLREEGAKVLFETLVQPR